MDRLSIRLIILTSVSCWIILFIIYRTAYSFYLVSIMIHKILLFFPTFLDEIDSIYLGVGPYSRKPYGKTEHRNEEKGLKY